MHTTAIDLVKCMAILCLIDLAGHSLVNAESSAPSFSQTETSLALHNALGKTIWQLNVDPQQDKPFFHPIALADGTILTALRPADHIWHRGLWWSWKTINGLNYWEEDADTLLAQGRNEITDVQFIPHRSGEAKAMVHINYHPPDQPSVLREIRQLWMSAPDAIGAYSIQWTSTFVTQEQDVRLDRTPVPGEPNGVVWGGYAGLSVRFASNATHPLAVDSEGHNVTGKFNHIRARWCDYTVEAANGQPMGIAIFDHPANLRHPSPWYISLGQGMKYFSPALLYEAPYTLKGGQTLTLRYRLYVHPGRTDVSAMNKQWVDFSKTTRPK